ncbi:MAG TPA: ABC transporter permease [Pyrinomonadaceae bacterium]|nr:ABC transporter permease [Pyrinomonadaceae bacterium]
MVADITQDLKYALRSTIKHPLFSLIGVLTIAIGIGVNVLVFSLVERILLNPLPYNEPDRLVRMVQSYPDVGLDTWGLSQANFARYRDNSHSFEAIAAYGNAGITMTGADTPEFLQATRVTADYFKVFGVSPLLGRTFQTGEDTPGNNAVAVLSEGLWQRRFGSDPQIVGKTLVLADTSTQVIGVMPKSFMYPSPETDVWIPMALNPEAATPFMFVGVARLKPGLDISAAVADTTTVFKNAAAQNPKLIGSDAPPPPDAGLKTVLTPLKESVVGKIEKPLLILQIAVAFVLLIACANLANLLLARATRRTQEISLRLALGASPNRIVRQLITESLVLAMIGAVVGTALAWIALRFLSSVYAQAIPRIEEAGISVTVLAATIGMTLLTGLLFGMMPAFRAYWLGAKRGMNEGQKGSASYESRRLNSALVVVQLAFSLVLLIGAGLVLKSFQKLLSVDPGFKTEGVMTMMLPVSSKKYTSNGQALQFYRKLLDEVRALPGVKGAAVTAHIPLGGTGAWDGFVVEGKEPQGDEIPQAEITVISPGYFQALGMPLLQGRDFQNSDVEESQLVAIIDKKLADQYFPGGDAIGKRIRTGDPEWYTIVGVVPTIKTVGLNEPTDPHFYMASNQAGFVYGQSRELRRYYFVLKTDTPGSVMPMIRERIRALDPDVPIYNAVTLQETIDKSVESQRLINLLLGSFSVIALLLAAIGTYGVMSLFVNSRAAEFAIRLALGAQPRSLLASVLKQGLVLAALGTVLGLVGSWMLMRAIESQLFEVSTTDPIVFTLIPAMLILVTLLASFLPAIRAARTDPAVVLRNA